MAHEENWAACPLGDRKKAFSAGFDGIDDAKVVFEAIVRMGNDENRPQRAAGLAGF